MEANAPRIADRQAADSQAKDSREADGQANFDRVMAEDSRIEPRVLIN